MRIRTSERKRERVGKITPTVGCEESELESESDTGEKRVCMRVCVCVCVCVCGCCARYKPIITQELPHSDSLAQSLVM